jgi:hypothetical protein
MGKTSHKGVVDREWRRMREKSCVWVIGMWWSIKRAKTAERVQERKERHRADGCLERAELEPC